MRRAGGDIRFLRPAAAREQDDCDHHDVEQRDLEQEVEGVSDRRSHADPSQAEGVLHRWSIGQKRPDRMRQEQDGGGRHRNPGTCRAIILPPGRMRERRAEARQDQDDRVVFRQQAQSHHCAEQHGMLGAACIDRAHKEIAGPGPEGQEYGIGIIEIAFEGIEWGAQQEHDRGLALPAVGEPPHEPPRTGETDGGIEHREQYERPVRVGKRHEPDAGDPGPERRMLVVPQLKFAAPDIRLGQVDLHRLARIGNRAVGEPDRDECREKPPHGGGAADRQPA